MARPREFDRDAALIAAISVFSKHGYEGTSTELLVQNMGIGRQSLYGAFGDKWQLYLEALQRYTGDSISEQIRTLNAPSSPLAGLTAHIQGAVAAAIADPSPSCLGISATCEFGRSNSEVSVLSRTANRALTSALERRVAEAKAKEELAEDVDTREAASFIVSTLVGIKVAARGGASPEVLRGIARMALRSLR